MKDFLENSDLSGGRAKLWPLGQRMILWVISVLAKNK